MELNIQLNEEYQQKLEYVQQQTEKDVTEVIQCAIDVYYNQMKPSRKTALEIFQESNFIGCIQVDSNLSTNYKSIVSTAIQTRNNYAQDL